MMDAIEKRALDLLCGEIDLDPEDYDEGERIEAGEALRAIVAALTPPEGYVLVPLETLEEIKHYAEGYVSTHDFVLMTKERKMLHVRKAQEILSSCQEVP